MLNIELQQVFQDIKGDCMDIPSSQNRYQWTNTEIFREFIEFAGSTCSLNGMSGFEYLRPRFIEKCPKNALLILNLSNNIFQICSPEIARRSSHSLCSKTVFAEIHSGVILLIAKASFMWFLLKKACFYFLFFVEHTVTTKMFWYGNKA